MEKNYNPTYGGISETGEFSPQLPVPMPMPLIMNPFYIIHFQHPAQSKDKFMGLAQVVREHVTILWCLVPCPVLMMVVCVLLVN